MKLTKGLNFILNMLLGLCMIPLIEVRQGNRVLISASFNKADGSPGRTDGKPSWTVSNEVAFTLIPSDDGMSCELLANVTGEVASAEFTLHADGDLGLDVKDIHATDTVSSLLPLGATSASFTVSEPMPIEAPVAVDPAAATTETAATTDTAAATETTDTAA